MKNLKQPKEIIATVLELNVDMLSDESALGETPNWDSLNHVVIIAEIENNYGIQIRNEDIDQYQTIKAINELYNKISSRIGSN